MECCWSHDHLVPRSQTAQLPGSYPQALWVTPTPQLKGGSIGVGLLLCSGATGVFYSLRLQDRRGGLGRPQKSMMSKVEPQLFHFYKEYNEILIN